MAITEVLGRMAQAVKRKIGESSAGPEKTSSQDGNAPPQDGLTEAQREYGPNYEQLKEKNPRVASALLQLVLEYRLEAIYAQRQRTTRIKYARLFWQEIQYAFWNESNGDFDWGGTLANGPSPSGYADDLATGPRFQYTTNWYTGYGLSFVALISQDVPSLSVRPKSRMVQEDVTAAKIAQDVVDVIESNNDPHEALETIGRYLWTDGVCYGYSRYVVDGERFGYKEMPVMGSQPMDLGGGQSAPMPAQQGVEKIPLGQEVTDYLGGLEVATPVYADKFHNYPYIQWNSEPHIAQVKDAYPHIADKIEQEAGGMSAEQVYERLARLGVKQNLTFLAPGDALQNLPTFSRTWLRRWAFNRLEDKALVAELKKLFPDGCYVAFASFEYCEARNESMDAHWRVRHALPGDGQSRPSVGGPLISPQERYNDLSNLQTEVIEYGVPPIYADPGTLDFDALANHTAEPAVHFPARAKPGMALGDSFFQPAPATAHPELSEIMRELSGPTMQFLCGMFPAIFGGEMSDVKTAAGYAMARDQAMGRLGLVWRGVKWFYAENIELCLKLFQKNRPEDVEVPFLGESDEEEARMIRLADFRGNVSVKYEPDEGLPRLGSQQRAILERLLAMGEEMPPEFAKALSKPSNISWIKTVLGLNDLDVPGEDADILAMRVIQQLLKNGPVEFPPAPTPQQGPNGPVIVLVPQQPQSTLQLDPILALDTDFIGLMLAKFIEWAGTDSGQDQAKSNPKGYQNVYLFAKQLSGVVAQAQQAAFQQQLALKHAPPKPPAVQQPKGPSLSDKVTVFPPRVQSQMLAQDGIQATPEELEAQQNQNRQDKADELQARIASKGAPGQEAS